MAVPFALESAFPLRASIYDNTSSESPTCSNPFWRWEERWPNHGWLQSTFTHSSMSVVLGILKGPRCISIHNHYLSQAKGRWQATLHMIFVFQTADRHTHIYGRCLPGHFLADIFIPWFLESFLQIPQSGKISRWRQYSYLGRGVSILAGVCQPSRGHRCHCLAWVPCNASLWNWQRSLGL